MPGINIGVYSILAGCCLSRAENCHVHHHHHHHLFAQFAEMNSKICNVPPDRKANSFSSNNCPWVQLVFNTNAKLATF